MKLHTPDRQVAVRQTHDFPSLCFRRDLKTIRKARPLHQQRVVARRLHRIRQPLKQIGVLMHHRTGLSVHQAVRPDDLPPEILPDTLVPETNPQQRFLPGKSTNHLKADPRLIRRARSRRNHHTVGIQRQRFVDRDRVVAEDLLFDPKLNAMSRVVGGQRLLGAREKEVFRKMLWQVADFSGVEVLTYCVMDNHFHVLVRVPERDRVISDGELLRRFRVLYPKPTKYQTASFKRFEAGLQTGSEEATAMRERLLKRMHDLSEFMKTLKQRFSIWYNRNHDNRLGTLWMERFKSVLVQGAGNPLQTMAAYIDLNPVRAGLVEDPKDYRWCGYAEAVAGARCAQLGLARIWSTHADGSKRERDGPDLLSRLWRITAV